MGKDNLWIIGAYRPWKIFFLFLTSPLSPLHQFQKSTLVILMNNQMGNYNFAMSVERVFFPPPFFRALAVSACQLDTEWLDMDLMIPPLPPAHPLKLHTQEAWRHQATRQTIILARHFLLLSAFHTNKVQTWLKNWDIHLLYNHSGFTHSWDGSHCDLWTLIFRLGTTSFTKRKHSELNHL